MSGTLLLHSGGWAATVEHLANVPVPPATESYVPVPYPRLVEEVKLQLPRFGLTLTREEYALAREGRQMFGVFSTRNGTPKADYDLAIGLRSSYDRSLSVGLVAGARVLCCDNLAFSGDVHASRKHTTHVLRDLPGMVYGMLTWVCEQRDSIDERVASMKRRSITDPEADHLIMEALRVRILPASRLHDVLKHWDKPRHEDFVQRTLWSLYNAFTEVLKVAGPSRQITGSQRLASLFLHHPSSN